MKRQLIAATVLVAAASAPLLAAPPPPPPPPPPAYHYSAPAYHAQSQAHVPPASKPVISPNERRIINQGSKAPQHPITRWGGAASPKPSPSPTPKPRPTGPPVESTIAPTRPCNTPTPPYASPPPFDQPTPNPCYN